MHQILTKYFFFKTAEKKKLLNKIFYDLQKARLFLKVRACCSKKYQTNSPSTCYIKCSVQTRLVNAALSYET